MTSLDSAGEAWREGRIIDAQRDYKAILATAPDSWGALFQLAWLDGIFGKLSPERIQPLRRSSLSESAKNMIRALEGMSPHPVPLEGSVADWDIETLRQRGRAETYSSWWEAQGKAAFKAGLYGVALACFEEAETREVNGAYWDPPGWTHSLPALVDGHLAVVARPD